MKHPNVHRLKKFMNHSFAPRKSWFEHWSRNPKFFFASAYFTLSYSHNFTLSHFCTFTLSHLGKVAKKIGKSLVFDQTGGRGGLRGYFKNQTSSVIMYFLKWACKTILGPLKHVLHLGKTSKLANPCLNFVAQFFLLNIGWNLRNAFWSL